MLFPREHRPSLVVRRNPSSRARADFLGTGGRPGRWLGFRREPPLHHPVGQEEGGGGVSGEGQLLGRDRRSCAGRSEGCPRTGPHRGAGGLADSGNAGRGALQHPRQRAAVVPVGLTATPMGILGISLKASSPEAIARGRNAAAQKPR